MKEKLDEIIDVIMPGLLGFLGGIGFMMPEVIQIMQKLGWIN